jgi:dihydroorotate dehydrogenase (NAD+) catalytic subunit
VKAKRKGVAANSKRTPTVRRIQSAITPARPRGPALPSPSGSRSGSSPSSAASSASSASASSASSASASSSGPAGAPALDALGGRPVDLAVDLGRGLVLPNPVMVASGPFGYGVEVADVADLPRLGGLVTRSTSLKPRAGQPGPRMVEVAAGLLLGMGPQNPGLETVLDRYAGVWARWEVPVILSLCADSAGELGEAVRRLEGEAGIAGLEINLSCGGGGRGGVVPGLDADAAGSYVAAARRGTDLPIIAKLTAQAVDVRAIARSVEDAGADAISAINTLPGFVPSGDRRGAALGSVYGGLCGPAIRPIALRVVWEVAQAVDVPVIGVGGVSSVDDVLDFLAVGASAVGVGVAALADPMLPVRLADELADACRVLGVAAARDLVGTAVPARPGPSSTRGAEWAR